MTFLKIFQIFLPIQRNRLIFVVKQAQQVQLHLQNLLMPAIFREQQAQQSGTAFTQIKFYGLLFSCSSKHSKCVHAYKNLIYFGKPKPFLPLHFINDKNMQITTDLFKVFLKNKFFVQNQQGGIAVALPPCVII